MTKDEAIAMYDSGWWKGKTDREIVAFQLYEDRLCLPFSEFHRAIETALGRSVWTHEFGLNRAGLQAEFEGKRGPASTAEIFAQLEALGKPIIVIAPEKTP